MFIPLAGRKPERATENAGASVVFSISCGFLLRGGRNSMNDTLTNVSTAHMVQVRTATEGDAAAIAEIYNQGIEDRVATYETTLRTAEDRRAWLRAIAGRYP